MWDNGCEYLWELETNGFLLGENATSVYSLSYCHFFTTTTT